MQPPPNYQMPPGGYPPYGGWTPEQIEMYNYKQRAKEIATISLVMAVIGLLVGIIGIILGPLAIKKAREAKGMLYSNEPGYNYAELGEIIGWCTTVLSIIGLLFLYVISCFSSACWAARCNRF